MTAYESLMAIAAKYEKLDEITRAYRDLQPEYDQKKSFLAKAKMNLENVKLDSNNERRLTLSEKTSELKKAVELAQRDFDEVALRYNTLRDQANILDEDILNLKSKQPEVTLSDLQELSNNKKLLDDELETLLLKKADVSHVDVSDLVESVNNAQALYNEMIALKEIGKASAQEVKPVKADLEKFQAELSKANVKAGELNGIRRGFDGLIISKQEEIDRFESKRTALYLQHFDDLDKKAGCRISKLIDDIKEVMCELACHDSLRAQFGGSIRHNRASIDIEFMNQIGISPTTIKPTIDNEILLRLKADSLL